MEVDCAVIIDSLVEVDGSPGAGHQPCVKPACKSAGVSYRCREGDHLHCRIFQPHLCNDHLEGRAPVRGIDQMDLIDYKEGYLIQPGRCIPKQRIDLLACGNDEIISPQILIPAVKIPCGNADPCPLAAKFFIFF